MSDTHTTRPLHRQLPPAANPAIVERWQREQGPLSPNLPEAIAGARRAADAAELTIAQQRRMGKHVLEELLQLLMGFVALFQPWPPGQSKNPYENRELFDRYMLLAIKCASAVAPFQSPKAIIIKTDRRPEDDPDLTKLTDEELQTWRRLLIKAQRGPTIDAAS